MRFNQGSTVLENSHSRTLYVKSLGVSSDSRSKLNGLYTRKNSMQGTVDGMVAHLMSGLIRQYTTSLRNAIISSLRYTKTLPFGVSSRRKRWICCNHITLNLYQHFPAMNSYRKRSKTDRWVRSYLHKRMDGWRQKLIGICICTKK